MSKETSVPVNGRQGLDGASTIEYAVEINHSSNSGIVVLPIAGPIGTPASVVRRHAPIEYRSVLWSAARLGGVPKVPAWDSYYVASNLNFIFLGGVRTADVPSPVTVGHWFLMAGRYDYAMVIAEGLASNFQLGKMPWENSTTFDNDIPSIFFDPYAILSTATTVAVPFPAMIQGPSRGAGR